jgi:hypothetical protein
VYLRACLNMGISLTNKKEGIGKAARSKTWYGDKHHRRI